MKKDTLTPEIIRIVNLKTGKTIFEGNRAFFSFTYNTMMKAEKAFKEMHFYNCIMYVNDYKVPKI